ncbi:MAG: hypothetical protein ABI970_13750 [Chloroflexota bacterium]
MLIALILIFISIFFILFVVGREPIPWTNRLRRIHAGVSRKAEWVAPDDVVHEVCNDYLHAVEWLAGAAVGEQTNRAPHYLAGRFLTRFQTIINYQNAPHRTYFIGVMTARHHLQVRQFSEDGCRCLVVDCQTERHMESLHLGDCEWSLAQDLGDGALVFQMCYDTNARRWKIESFIQELPAGWGNHADVGRVRLFSHLPTTIGRDF